MFPESISNFPVSTVKTAALHLGSNQTGLAYSLVGQPLATPLKYSCVCLSYINLHMFKCFCTDLQIKTRPGPQIQVKSTLSFDRLTAVDYPAGPATCGPCWLSAKDQEAVIAAHICEQEKQVRGGSLGCHPAVSVRKVTNPVWHLGSNAYDRS